MTGLPALLALLCLILAAAIDSYDADSSHSVDYVSNEHCYDSVDVFKKISNEAPTLPELLVYKTSSNEIPISIIDHVAASKNYNRFIICILNDETGGSIIESNLDQHHITNSLIINLSDWLNKETETGSATWDTVITCLSDSGLTKVSDQIAEALSERSSNYWRKLCKDNHPNDSKGSYHTEWVSPLELYKQQFDRSQTLLKSLEEITMEFRDFTRSEVLARNYERLQEINAHLVSGKLRAVLVGFKKSGKSTFLNALLGNSFLPMSVHVNVITQTTEVTIIHDPSIPEGELWEVKVKGSDPQPIANARGRDKIQEYLFELNQLKDRDRGFHESLYHRLILRAPLPFLSDHHIPLDVELADISGLERVEGSQISDMDELIDISNFCAKVLILNYEYLRGTLDELNALEADHPELFHNLNQIIIIVNAYDRAFVGEDEIPSVQTIREEVLGYLETTHLFIDRKIRVKHVILVSAKYALYAREWSKNVTAFLQNEKVEFLYEEALSRLRRAGYKDKLQSLSEKPDNEETVLNLTEYLEEFSNFSVAENDLSELLSAYGRTELLRSAVNDAISVAEEILEETELLIQNATLNLRQTCRQCWKDAIRGFNNTLKNEYSVTYKTLEKTVQNATSMKVEPVLATLQYCLFGLVSSELGMRLPYSMKKSERKPIIELIVAAKSELLDIVLNEMKSSWVNIILDTLGKAAVSVVEQIIVEIQTSLELLPTLSNDLAMCSMVNGTKMFNETLSRNLNPNFITPAKLIDSASRKTLNIELTYEGEGSSAVADEALRKFVCSKNVTEEVPTNTFENLGPRFGVVGHIDGFKKNVSTSQNDSVYSIDNSKLQKAFEVIARGWNLQFNTEVDNLLKELSALISTKTLEHINEAFLESEDQLTNMCQARLSQANGANSIYSGYLKRKLKKINDLKSELEQLSFQDHG